MSERIRLVLLIAATLLLTVNPIQANEAVFKMDFSNKKPGNAEDWFKKEKFKFRNDADEINARFEDGTLVLEVDDDINGLYTQDVHISGADTVRIEWGVNRFPEGANWEKGNFREAIGVVISFGDEGIDSGSFFIPDAPYFIGIFLGQYEKEGKAYIGNYYRKGGRFFCVPCGIKEGQTVVTEFDLIDAFRKEYGNIEIPFISSITLEVDARDTDGKSKAFIKSITFFKR